MNNNRLVLSFALLSLFLCMPKETNNNDSFIYKPIRNEMIQLSSDTSKNNTLRILNWEDYQYEYEEPGEEEEDEYPQYKDMTLVDIFVEYMKTNYNRDINVVYDTFDTNEVMLNTLKLGKATYDLVVPSDYAIQKMIRDDLIIPFNKENIPNYEQFASPYLRNELNKINAKTTDGRGDVSIGDYTAGYMWGTLGLIFNPEYDMFTDRNMSQEQVFDDMRYWTTLWNDNYRQSFSIKDSLRDTYSVGIMKHYDEYFKTIKSQYEGGEISLEEYKNKLTTAFNDTKQETIDEVGKELKNLKDHSFGFEVDSGKNDILTGKIGANIAWSGDAVYSLDEAEAPEVNKTLYYSVPETGANIWFDGWVMPKGANQELAEKFVNFVSDPSIAVLNMWSIGYSSFIGGDQVIDMVRDWYDGRLFNENGQQVDEEGNPTNDVDEELEEVDLSYFFDGTYVDYESSDAIFYAEEYLPFKDTGNLSVGRQFFTQYPDEETIKRCAIMDDFGSSNAAVLKMWEKLKTNEISIWMIVVTCVELSLIIGITGYFVINKFLNKKRRQTRREENVNN